MRLMPRRRRQRHQGRTPQGPRVCQDCNVALPIAAYRQTCSTARSATWTSKAARSFIGYQTIPFQWSLHAIDDDDVMHHREFLADGGDNPRRRFAETLIEALAAFDAPILVYSAYEQTRLKDLAGEYPDLAQRPDRPAGGAVANCGRRRLLSRLPIQQLDKIRCPALCPGFGRRRKLVGDLGFGQGENLAWRCSHHVLKVEV
jgi:Domain of unknown function(DUF2779)